MAKNFFRRENFTKNTNFFWTDSSLDKQTLQTAKKSTQQYKIQRQSLEIEKLRIRKNSLRRRCSSNHAIIVDDQRQIRRYRRAHKTMDQSAKSIQNAFEQNRIYINYLKYMMPREIFQQKQNEDNMESYITDMFFKTPLAKRAAQKIWTQYKQNRIRRMWKVVIEKAMHDKWVRESTLPNLITLRWRRYLDTKVVNARKEKARIAFVLRRCKEMMAVTRIQRMWKARDKTAFAQIVKRGKLTKLEMIQRTKRLYSSKFKKLSYECIERPGTMATFVAGWLNLQKDGYTSSSFEDRRRTSSFSNADEAAFQALLAAEAECPEIEAGMSSQESSIYAEISNSKRMTGRLASQVYNTKSSILKDYVSALGKTVSQPKRKSRESSRPHTGNRTGSVLKPEEFGKQLLQFQADLFDRANEDEDKEKPTLSKNSSESSKLSWSPLNKKPPPPRPLGYLELTQSFKNKSWEYEDQVAPRVVPIKTPRTQHNQRIIFRDLSALNTTSSQEKFTPRSIPTNSTRWFFANDGSKTIPKRAFEEEKFSSKLNSSRAAQVSPRGSSLNSPRDSLPTPRRRDQLFQKMNYSIVEIKPMTAPGAARKRPVKYTEALKHRRQLSMPIVDISQQQKKLKHP